MGFPRTSAFNVELHNSGILFVVELAAATTNIEDTNSTSNSTISLPLVVTYLSWDNSLLGEQCGGHYNSKNVYNTSHCYPVSSGSFNYYNCSSNPPNNVIYQYVCLGTGSNCEESCTLQYAFQSRSCIKEGEFWLKVSCNSLSSRFLLSPILLFCLGVVVVSGMP